jgi:branched-subunit amino acid transport protein
VSTELVLLAVLMGAATYPSRAVPLLIPGLDRLGGRALLYLRLVGPAVLAALGTVNVLLVSDATGALTPGVGIETLAATACVVVVARRGNLFLGLVVAVALVALGRAAGLG